MEYKSEKRICQNCKKDFTIEPDDFAFYEKMKVPPPTFCPECRLIRRMVFRNERTLYKRVCDLCGEDKILMYPKDSQYRIYCYECFYGDNWDGAEYGMNYDFSKQFFVQYAELFKNVPKMGMVRQGLNVNGEYTNRVSDSKDCYLIFGSNKNQNCFYGVSYWNSNDSVDCYNLRKSEKCYECIDCYNCNGLKYSNECNSCIDSCFLEDCRNCQNCFGCVNLRSKNYCIFNKQYTKEEYQKKISEMNIDSRVNVVKMKEKIKEEFSNHIVPSIIESRSVNVSGNWIENSKNAKDAFNCENVEDGKYLFGLTEAKDVMDYTYWGRSSDLIYEANSVGRECSFVLFGSESWDYLNKVEYCINCFSSSDLFGCMGLRKKQYCILNKQYTKEEYEKLVPQIKKQMMEMPYVDKRGIVYRYGEFFPCDLTPFAYNETIAQEYKPKTKEQAIALGFTWKDPETRNYVPTVLPNELPGNINLVNDNILNEIIACAHCGKCNQQCTMAFKIVPDELQFYRANNIPLPTLCPNCRNYERLGERQPLKLWHRKCMCEQKSHEHNGQCQNEFETSYAPDRQEMVYCLECYRREVV